MAAATGSIAIASAGGSFDSADYPRFVLGDGTNSLTFVIDNDARGLKLDDESTAATSYSSTSDFPLEDPMKGKVLIPTIDEADGAQKSILALWMHDSTSVNTLAAAISGESVLDGSDNLIAITSRLHWEVTDSDGNTIRIGMGGSTQGKKSTVEGHMSGNVYRHQAQNGAGQTWYSAYQEDTTGTNYLVHVTTTGGGDDYAEYRLPVAFYGAFKAAYEDGNINIDAYELAKEASGDGLRQSSLGSNQYGSGADTYTRGVLLEYKTAGTKGNACRIVLKDPNGVLDSDAKQRGVSYGYEEYTSAAMRAAYGNRDDSAGTNDVFPGENLNTEIYFRGGTVAGSGSDSPLSTAQIAEAIKEIVNSSKLGITATRSDSTVSLENDTDGDSGNVTITTTNAGALFTVAGMDNTEAASGGGSSVARRTTVSADQLELKSSGGLSASADNKAGLRLSVDQLASTASIMGSSFIPMEESGGSVSKKITVDNLLGSLVAGSDTQVQFNQHGTSLAANSNFTYDGSGSLTVGTAFVIGSANMSEADLEKLDGITNGTAAANKALVLDADSKITSGLTALTASFISASVEIAAKTLRVASDSIIIGSTTLSETELAFNDGITAGTAAASKAVILDSDLDTSGIRNITSTGTAKAAILSGSGDSTIHKVTMNQLVAGTADINGGAIDGATIGASSQSSVKATTLSGSSTLNVAGVSSFGAGSQASISAAGLISSSAENTLYKATMDRLVAGTADINGGSVDGATIGAASQSSVKATTLSGSSTLNVAGASTFGPADYASISAAGVISGSAVATFPGITVGTAVMDEADLEKLDGITNGAGAAGKALVLDSSRDINNINNLTASYIAVNTLDVVTINSVTQTETTLEIQDKLLIAGSGSASSAADGGGLQIGGTDGSDSVASILYEHTGAKLEMKVAGTAYASVDSGGIDVVGQVSGSGALTGQSLTVQSAVQGVSVTDGSATLTGGGLTLAGALGGATTISGSGVASVLGLTVGTAVLDEADLEKIDGITNGTAAASKALVLDSNKDADGLRNLTTTGTAKAAILSGSGDSTIHKVTMNQLVAATADVNGGSIDGATIGASSQSSVKATTLSGSSTLSVVGASSFGPGALASISAAGVLSGSGDSTIHKITMNQLVAGTADINGGAIDGATIGASSQSSVKATTLSGSSTLSVVGVSSFGPGALATISAAGVVSGSGNSTLHRLTADRVSDGTATLAGGALTLGGALAGATTISGSGVVSGNGLTVGTAVLNEEDLEKIDGITNGTVAANKAVVVDGNADAAGFRALSGSGTSTLHQVTADRVTVAAASLTAITFGGTAIAASAAELNTIADVSAGGDHAAAIDVSADHFLFRDAGATGAHKVESFADLATAQAGAGLQASAGAFSIVAVEDHFVSSSANEGSTFLLSQTASSDSAVSVYVNGIFQAQAGATHGSGNGDYSISGSTLNGQFIVLVDANKVDEDDEVVVKYIKA